MNDLLKREHTLLQAPETLSKESRPVSGGFSFSDTIISYYVEKCNGRAVKMNPVFLQGVITDPGLPGSVSRKSAFGGTAAGTLFPLRRRLL